ncbi:VENN motif pre-toxin domain-containing protein, partial [Providencia stuartii]|uniref:VENN motif pre-toxin domain-containing protein n=1 Tax=Providencia stuartii TaxID=588 RepID=UPI0015E0A256
GENAGAQSLGAMTAEAVGMLSKELYGKDPSKLTEDEKATVSAFASLAAGIAGGLVGGDTSDAANAAQAGKTTVENNSMALGGNLGFLFTDIPDCDASCKADITKGINNGNLVVSGASMGVVAAGYSLVIAPEMIATVRAALTGCKAAPVICLNEVGIFTAEVVTPGGTGAGGALIIGKTAQEVSTVKQVIQSEAKAGKINLNQLTSAESTSINSSSKLPPSSTVISTDIETKILEGQRVGSSNKLIGGHSPSINNENPNYAVELVKLNPDGTRVIKFVTQFPDGNVSKIKTSTIFPENWSDKSIIDSINKVGNLPAIGQRSTTGETLHRGIVNGIEIDVIKKGNEVTAGYPVGGKPTPGFEAID